MAQLLNSAGFEVISATDLTQNDMLKVVQDFSAKVAARGHNTVAMVYYAGHGVQLAGENYLVPVDAKISSPNDLASNSLRLVDVMATLESIPSRMRIVLLDACRNNPFPGVNDAGRGLAIVDAPNGSIVGYSTAPGTEALDGTGGHSPYTSAFLNVAREPNLPIEQLFKRVRLEVNNTTDGKQIPWESSSLTSDFTFFGDTAVAADRAPDQSARWCRWRPTCPAARCVRPMTTCCRKARRNTTRSSSPCTRTTRCATASAGCCATCWWRRPGTRRCSRTRRSPTRPSRQLRQQPLRAGRAVICRPSPRTCR